MTAKARPWCYALLAVGLAATLAASCDRLAAGDEDPTSGREETGHVTDPAAPQGTGKRPSTVVTRFSQGTELFLEYPILVAGEESPFAAHLTWLDGYRPVASGRLTVTLSRDGQIVAGFRVPRPTRPGLYTPVIEPRDPGVFDMTLTWEQGDRRSVHRLESVRVYASRKKVPRGQTDAGGGITFLKEQQWRVPFRTTVITERTLRATVPATGVLRAAPAGEHRVTAPVAGRVQRPAGGFPEVGQHAEADTVLARIIPQLGVGTDLATLRLAVTEAEADFQHARRERRRLEGLLAKEAVPERRVVQARSQARLAKARLAVARQRLAAYQERDPQGKGPAAVPVMAGVAGTVAEVHAQPGDYLEEGASLMRVVNPRRLWLEARVPEAEAIRLEEPTGAWYTPVGGEKRRTVDTTEGASLVSAGEVVARPSRTVPVIFALANDNGLRVGTAAEVRVWTGETVTAPAVPVEAVQTEAGEPVVYVMAGGETFQRRVVQLGIRAGDYVAVTDGLEAGERVVAAGSYLVRLAGGESAGAGHGHTH